MLVDSVQFLKELVGNSSFTSDILGVRRVQHLVAGELKSLGFRISWETPADGNGIHSISKGVSNKALLVAEFPFQTGRVESSAKEKKAEKWITLISHADTVFEKRQTEITVHSAKKGAILRGPGIIDDKGSVIVGLEALKGLNLKGLGHSRYAGIRFVVSPNEEIGSPGFRANFAQISNTSEMILGLEPSLDDGSIVTSRRGNLWYRVRSHGHTGHSGRDFSKSVNAVSDLIFRLSALKSGQNLKKNTTYNIGSIHGGTVDAPNDVLGKRDDLALISGVFNRVSNIAEAEVEFRLSTLSERSRIMKLVKKVMAQKGLQSIDGKSRTNVFYECTDDCPPLEDSQSVRRNLLLKRYLKNVLKIEKRNVVAGPSGGSSDANYLARPGLMIIDGLGASGGLIHTKDEFLNVSSLATRSEALGLFLHDLLSNQS